MLKSFCLTFAFVCQNSGEEEKRSGNICFGFVFEAVYVSFTPMCWPLYMDTGSEVELLELLLLVICEA